MKDYKILIKNSGFVHLWISQLFSQITVNMMNFLILTRLFTVTGSSIATSLLWVAYALPSIFFGPIGAAAVDLVSRKKILVATNFLQALTVFVFFLSQDTSIFLLYVVVLLYSFFNQFYIPAETSSLPSMVPKPLFVHANSLFFISQQASIILGFGMAGILQNMIGFNGSLILCTVFLFIAFVSTTFLPEMKPSVKVPRSLDRLLITFFKSIYQGYKFIKENKIILFPLLLLLGVQIGLAMILVTIPLIAVEILKVSVSYAGLLIIVPAGIGATIGSFIISKNLKLNWRKKFVIESSAAIIAAALFLIVFLIPFLSITLRVILEPFFVILIGLGFVGITIPAVTFLQESTPIWLRGRVFGNFWFLTTICTIFPVLFSGVFVEFLGVRSLLIIMMLAIIFVFYYSKKHGQELIEKHF